MSSQPISPKTWPVNIHLQSKDAKGGFHAEDQLIYPVYFKAKAEFDHLVYVVINRKQQVMLDKYKKVCLFIFLGAGRLSQLP